MFRLLWIVGVLLLTSISTRAQFSKSYTIKDSPDFDTVNFYMKSTVTNCLLKQSKKEDNPLAIYGNPDLEKIHPSFVSTIKNNTCNSTFLLDEYTSSGFGDSFTMVVSGRDKDLWKIHLNENKIYKLNLVYGVGKTKINLACSSIQRLKIRSGSADIVVGYDEGSMNMIEMDTFYIKAGLGSIEVKRMGLARAKNIITKVGFGDISLDFAQKILEKCNVVASIGAGNLEIAIPKDSPIIINLKDSPLCSVRIAKGFEKIDENIFVNTNYSENAKNLLSFDVDVALGMVHFLYTD